MKNMDKSELTVEPYHPYPTYASYIGEVPYGVRVRHNPTGVEASCHDHKSQHNNYLNAIAALRLMLQERGT